MMSENPSSKIQNPKSRIIWILFILLIVAVYFFGLNLPLLGPDEPRYSQIAREMYERGDWITPKLGGFDWFEKPALLYWLQIASYRLFGVSEFAARFGSALFGLGTILSLWILGRRWSADKNKTERVKAETNSSFILNPSSFANWLALIAASAIGLIAFAHGASFDIILTFPITASLVGFFIAETRREKSDFTFYFALFAFYFFIGVSLIAKGLVGIVFPFAIVAFYYVLSWKFPRKEIIFSFFWGIIVSLLTAAVWYLPMYQVNGWKFIDDFFIQHHFQRYTSNKYQHPQPFHFFFWVLPLMTLPWLPFFLAAIWNFLKAGIKKNDDKKGFLFLPFSASPLLCFAFAWLLVPLVFFSASGSKLPGYILPALPGALILTAEYIYRFIQKSEKRRNAILLTAFLTFIGVIITMQFFVMTYAQHETVKNLIQTANASGYENARIFNMHTTSHNSEFYGAGRVVRNADGKLRRVDGVEEIAAELNANSTALILVPLEYVKQLTESARLDARVLSDNGELAIVAVKLK